jgi:hypothetical protein
MAPLEIDKRIIHWIYYPIHEITYKLLQNNQVEARTTFSLTNKILCPPIAITHDDRPSGGHQTIFGGSVCISIQIQTMRFFIAFVNPIQSFHLQCWFFPVFFKNKHYFNKKQIYQQKGRFFSCSFGVVPTL